MAIRFANGFGIGASNNGGTPTPTPTPSSLPLSQFTPNGTSGSNGLLTYLNYTNGLDQNNAALLPDSSGFNHPYAWSGSNPYDVNVTGYTFSGGTWAYAQDASNYNLGFSSLTIEMWVKIPSIPGTMSLLAAGGSNAGGWALRIDGAGTQLNLVKYNIADQTVNLPTQLQPNTWYHIVAAQGGTSLTFFVNGEIVGAVNTATSNNFSFPNGTVNIAKDFYTGTYTALSLGILKVYDYCLLSTDVLSEFESTKTDYGYVSATPTPTPSGTSDVTPTPTPSVTTTSTPTPTPSGTSDVTPTPTPSVTTTSTPTPTPSSTPSASAPMTVTINEVGSNVVMTSTGTVNLSGLTFVQSNFGPIGQGGIGINSATFISGPGSGYANTYSGFTSVPSNFGSGMGGANSSGSGDVFGIIFNSAPPYFLVVPTGYTSGANISSTQTFNNTSLSTLGLTNGTYTYTWSGGSIDVVVGGPAPTPTPTPSTGANVGLGSWYFYSDAGMMNAGPPTGDGNALFWNQTTNEETFNPNHSDGSQFNLFFSIKDSTGTDYTSQFSTYTGGTGTITISQNGDTATYTSTTFNSFQIQNLGSSFFMINTSLCTQTKTSNAPFTYTDPISITFS